MSAWRALSEYFLAAEEGTAAPAPSRRAEPVARGAAPPVVGLVCGARDARSAGAAVGLQLARRHGARAAGVLLWQGQTPATSGHRGAPPSRAARRAVAGLQARDVAARAAGRLVVVDLPGEAQAAGVAAQRALASLAGLPTVLVMGGPRQDALDALLRGCDVVLVGHADGALSALAIESLRALGIEARRCELPAAPVAAVASAGAAVLPAGRRVLNAALDGAA